MKNKLNSRLKTAKFEIFKYSRGVTKVKKIFGVPQVNIGCPILAYYTKQQGRGLKFDFFARFVAGMWQIYFFLQKAGTWPGGGGA